MLCLDPGQGLLHRLAPGAGWKVLAMAMARQEPSHLEGLQALKRTDLLVEIPPAIALGTHQHVLVAVPPNVIAAEQNTLLITEQ